MQMDQRNKPQVFAVTVIVFWYLKAKYVQELQKNQFGVSGVSQHSRIRSPWIEVKYKKQHSEYKASSFSISNIGIKRELWLLLTEVSQTREQIKILP